jgi:anti-sigma regulatory factor (Ser/Thr protein kinase)
MTRAADSFGAGRDGGVGVLDELDLHVPSRTDAVAVARHAVARHLARHGVPSTVIDDIELVTSELVTNAIIHPRPVARDGVVHVHVGLSDAIELQVANTGPAASIPPVEEWSPAPATAVSGRGLGIVRRLSDTVKVEQIGERAVVTCRRRLPDGGARS